VSIAPTSTIGLGERTTTAKAFEAPLLQQEDHPMPTQGPIALAPQTRIMPFDADLLAAGTPCSLVDPDHFDFNAAVWL
jgi:hypothetical protein